jgi:hypothetical protein
MRGTEKQLAQLVEKLQGVAKEIEGDFRYRLEVTPPPLSPRYVFVVREAHEGKAFLTATGETITEAIAQAQAQIPTSCKAWSYKQ